VTIDDIKTINPYLGIDEYYTLGDNDSIPFAKDEKFFKYFRKTYQSALSQLGVVVQAYTNIAGLNFFNIDKGLNKISPANDFSSNTYINGNFTVQNTNGIQIITNGNKLRLKVNENDVSIENDNYPNQKYRSF
jgi:hypothetical protein